jgi:site-specific DNA recombinase
MTKKQVRCAIYTRKSSEEGLEQSFNSLEAQQEACRAYILSQKHEGWIEVKKEYDDGGFSGGSMERPALKRLLGDIQEEKIDAIVVYKVDRLTRSLADFAKMIEIFDRHKVSFVSVTQQFNTTTSMGRLTLNVLLSFAQFEREITGERIRDKVAASKKKGLWMGGVVPLGYDCVEHRLIVNSVEAETARTIFRQYLRFGCVKKLKDFLDEKQVVSKARTSSAGRLSGGTKFSRGALYHLLNNRIYLGEIVHHSQSYPGQHQSIVSQQLWDKVAARLKQNNQAHRTGKSSSAPSLLTGRLFDTNGIRLTPTHAVKNAKRYRYYTSQAVLLKTSNKPSIRRLPARELEELVKFQIGLLLRTPEKFTLEIDDQTTKDTAAERAEKMAREWPTLPLASRTEFVRSVLSRVVLSQKTVRIEIDRTKLLKCVLGNYSGIPSPTGSNNFETLRVECKFQVLRQGSGLRIVGPLVNGGFEQTPVRSLIKAVARARDWYERVVDRGVSTIEQLAEQSGVTGGYIRRILPCASLSPKTVESILSGSHRPGLTLNNILAHISLDWAP